VLRFEEIVLKWLFRLTNPYSLKLWICQSEKLFRDGFLESERFWVYTDEIKSISSSIMRLNNYALLQRFI